MSAPRLLRSLADLLLPRICPGCGERLALDEEEVCVRCLIALPRLSPLLWERDKRVQLFYDLPHVRRFGALTRYRQGNISAHLVHALKYHGHWRLGILMGRLMGRELEGSGMFGDADFILPMPITWRRRWHRGFNQTEYIARGISEVTGIPVRTDLLLRRRHTESQTHFAYHERIHKVDGAFGLAPGAEEQLCGRSIILLDDVVTSGCTMSAAAMALRTVEGLTVSCLSWSWTA